MLKNLWCVLSKKSFFFSFCPAFWADHKDVSKCCKPQYIIAEGKNRLSEINESVLAHACENSWVKRYQAGTPSATEMNCLSVCQLQYICCDFPEIARKPQDLLKKTSYKQRNQKHHIQQYSPSHYMQTFYSEHCGQLGYIYLFREIFTKCSLSSFFY